jgi:hypothetical protein
MKKVKAFKIVALAAILVLTYAMLDIYFYSWMIWQFVWTFRFATMFGFAFVVFQIGAFLISREWG